MPALPSFQMAPAVIADVQQQEAAHQTPAQRQLTQQIQQLPEYQQYLQDLQRGVAFGQSAAQKALKAQAVAMGMPDDWAISPAGSVVTKGFIDAHPVLYGALVTGALVGGAAAIGAAGGAGSAGVGLGETGATSGLDAGTIASLPGAAAAPTAGAGAAGGSLSSLSSFGEGGPVGGIVGPETALPVSTSVGPGTTAAAESGGFGAGSAAGVPEALAPTPLASTPTAAAGAYAPSVAPSGAVPAATGGGGVSLSGVGKTLSNPLIGGLITAGLQFAQSKANADAAKTASQQEIDAANKALALQKEEFDTSRGDYLSRQAYTQQQIGGLAPYEDVGTGAFANLRSLTGQPSRPGLANTPPVASLPPPVVPSGTLSSLSTQPADNRRPPTAGTPTGQTAIPKMITVRDVATGEVQQRPYAELQHWQSVPGAQVTA